MGIDPDKLGATYTSKGVVFVVLKIVSSQWAGLTARCLVLDDNPKFALPLKSGTVIEVESFTSFWAEAMRIASLGEQGKVAS